MLGSEFIRTDDGLYVVYNPHVQAGLTRAAIAWAFNIGYAGNWHPLTWMSHMLDCRLFGLNPMGHHAVNLLLHIASTTLLYLTLARATRSMWKSAFVAALFAVHPLHVESVAWVAERKDVLSTFFWMLTMWAYVRYTERPSWRSYIPVFVFLALGLMAKQMLVTLPFVLLLLDYWPLNRRQTTDNRRQKGSGTLVLEKVPLLILSVGAGVLVFLAQRTGGAMGRAHDMTFAWQVSNALLSYVRYLAKMVWPAKLVFFYPLGVPSSVGWMGIASAVLLIAVTVAVVMTRRRHPYLLMGWLWYLGTLIPVIGLVQVGAQSMADRYTYIPLIGIFIMLAWGAPELLRLPSSHPHSNPLPPTGEGVVLAKSRRKAAGEGVVGAGSVNHQPSTINHFPTLAVASLVIVAALSACTWKQVGYWHDDFGLCRHAIRYTEGNYMAYGALGMALADERKYDQAIGQYQLALKYAPSWSVGYDYLGAALAETGKYAQAESAYKTSLRLMPSSPKTLDGLGIVLAKQNKLDGAVSAFQESIRLDPQLPGAYANLGKAYIAQGKLDEAQRAYSDGLTACQGSVSGSSKEYAALHNGMGTALAYMGKLDEAAQEQRQAVQVNPKFAQAYADLGRLLGLQGKTSEAAAAYTEAIRLQPNDAVAHNGLGDVLLTQGDVKGATKQYREAVRLAPMFKTARRNLASVLSTPQGGEQSLMQAAQHFNRGNMYQSQRRLDDAIREYEAAVRARPSFAEAHGNLAIAYTIKGDYALAWREVHLCQKHGLQMPTGLINALLRKMPEPKG